MCDWMDMCQPVSEMFMWKLIQIYTYTLSEITSFLYYGCQGRAAPEDPTGWSRDPDCSVDLSMSPDLSHQAEGGSVNFIYAVI